MTASFDKQQLMAGLAELEKRVRQQRLTDRPAAAPSDRLDIDLAAIEAAVKSRSAPRPTAVADPAISADERVDRAAPSRSPKLDVVPARELRGSAAARESAPEGAAPEIAALLVDAPRDQAAPSRSATIELVADAAIGEAHFDSRSGCSRFSDRRDGERAYASPSLGLRRHRDPDRHCIARRGSRLACWWESPGSAPGPPGAEQTRPAAGGDSGGPRA